EDIDEAKHCYVVGGENKALYDHILNSIEENDVMDCAISYADGSDGVTGVSAYLGEYGPTIEVIKRKIDEPPLSGTFNSETGVGRYKGKGVFPGADGGPATLG